MTRLRLALAVLVAIAFLRARARLAEAGEVLAELEWGVADWEDIPGGTIETFSTCPSCNHRQREGHAPDCRLAAWLKEG